MVGRRGQISSRLLRRSTYKNPGDSFSIEIGKNAIIKTRIYSRFSKFITGSILLMKSEFQEVSVSGSISSGRISCDGVEAFRCAGVP